MDGSPAPEQNKLIESKSKSTATPCFFIRKVLKNDEFFVFGIYTIETSVLLDKIKRFLIFLKNYRFMYLNTNTPPRLTLT